MQVTEFSCWTPTPRIWKMAGFAALVCSAMAISASAQTFTVLTTFDLNNGGWPESSLVQGTDGNYYGTTSGGGIKNSGTAFRITPAGVFTRIHSFCIHFECPDGISPLSTLLLARKGKFYGTARYGGARGCNGYGCGTVFRINSRGRLITLHRFKVSDGSFPSGALIQGTDGNFYGTTQTGGVGGDFQAGGTIFKMTPAGWLTTLHSFDNPPLAGAPPTGTLMQGADGNFYGTTVNGGDLGCNASSGCGTVFKMTPKGMFTTLHKFENDDGNSPFGAIVQDDEGNLYGTTLLGGDLSCNPPFGCGTVFKMSPQGAFTTLHRFAGDPGDGNLTYAGLVQATDGNWYGTSSAGGNGCGAGFGCGAVFRISPNGASTLVYSFGLADGVGPVDTLFQATDGNLYGTAEYGGGQCFCGTLFRLFTSLGQFVSLQRYTGEVGEPVIILGHGLTGTTAVSFNNIPARFTEQSDTYLTATVPTGATSGFVTVVGPGGSLMSNRPFRIIR